mgnify:CR=1 FL=1
MKRSGVPVREAEPMVTLNPLGRDRPLGLAAASVRDYREVARRRLPRQLFDYIDGGAYEEATLAANTADLEAISLRQRVLRDVSTRTMLSLIHISEPTRPY